jgi:DNA polymerase
MEKAARYAALVEARKSCSRCPGLANPSQVEGGRFDSTDIGPWTQWLGDLNADVMVIGQDWGDQRAFVRQKGIDESSSATNTMLLELLGSIGYPVPRVDAPSRNSRVFLTNAVLCLKNEGCQGPVKPEWFSTCGVNFLRRQVELVKPRAVIALGQQAYAGSGHAFGFEPPGRFLDAVEDPPRVLDGGSLLFAVYHCGRRILNTHRKEHEQREDWLRIGAAIKQMQAQATANGQWLTANHD